MRSSPASSDFVVGSQTHETSEPAAGSSSLPSQGCQDRSSDFRRHHKRHKRRTRSPTAFHVIHVTRVVITSTTLDLGIPETRRKIKLDADPPLAKTLVPPGLEDG